MPYRSMMRRTYTSSISMFVRTRAIHQLYTYGGSCVYSAHACPGGTLLTGPACLRVEQSCYRPGSILRSGCVLLGCDHDGQPQSGHVTKPGVDAISQALRNGTASACAKGCGSSPAT